MHIKSRARGARQSTEDESVNLRVQLVVLKMRRAVEWIRVTAKVVDRGRLIEAWAEKWPYQV